MGDEEYFVKRASNRVAREDPNGHKRGRCRRTDQADGVVVGEGREGSLVHFVRGGHPEADVSGYEEGEGVSGHGVGSDHDASVQTKGHRPNGVAGDGENEEAHENLARRQQPRA